MNKNAWTHGEHERFLLGQSIYGKGKWAKISKKCVLTRTPTQVASHAQKYYKRMNPMVAKKRKSIFDVTDKVIVYRPTPRYPTSDWYKKYCIM